MAALSLELVLANVVRGRVAYLVLTPEQKRALRDRDGQTALDVLRHLLGARDAIRAPERFPLTEQAFQTVARRLGYVLGQRHCRRLVRRLRTQGVLAGSGSYRQAYRHSAVRSGFRVALHRLRRSLRPKRKRPVGNSHRVKSQKLIRWWEHPLFGDLLARPPPQFTRKEAREMRSLDEQYKFLG
jgi:hypothetical protein